MLKGRSLLRKYYQLLKLIWLTRWQTVAAVNVVLIICFRCPQINGQKESLIADFKRFEVEVIVEYAWYCVLCMWPDLPSCVQCAVRTLVRMTERVAWSQPPEKKYVTADVAIAGRTVALVSKSRTVVVVIFFMWALPCICHVCMLIQCMRVHAWECVCDNGLINDGRWRHEQAAKLVLSNCC